MMVDRISKGEFRSEMRQDTTNDRQSRTCIADVRSEEMEKCRRLLRNNVAKECKGQLLWNISRP